MHTATGQSEIAERVTRAAILARVLPALILGLFLLIL
jgi:hypothetical protein